MDGFYCRRVVLDLVMDRRTKRLSCEDKEERCGVYRWRGIMRSSVENGQKRDHESDIEDEQVSKHVQESSSIIARPKAPKGDSLVTLSPT